MISIAVLLGIVGAAFVALNKSTVANAIWSVSNVMLAYRAYTFGDFDSIKLFLTYEVICIYGLYRYFKEQRKSKNLSSQKT